MTDPRYVTNCDRVMVAKLIRARFSFPQILRALAGGVRWPADDEAWTHYAAVVDRVLTKNGMVRSRENRWHPSLRARRRILAASPPVEPTEGAPPR